MREGTHKKRKVLVAGTLAGLTLPLWMISILATQEQENAGYELRGPLGFHVPWGLDVFSLRIPTNNPIGKEKVELGKLLFFDRRLSRDGTVSCADCHNPRLAFTDGRAVATGIKARQGERSSPTLVNRAFSTAQFWDGRASSLEEQAKGPMVDPLEMGNGSHDDVVNSLKRVDGYRRLFYEAFGTEDFTIDDVAKAIATFERTLLSGNSPFDQFQRGDRWAISSTAERGFDLFRDRARCVTCHTGFNFTDEQFHTLGTGYERSDSDLGRYRVTQRERDKRKFKTPTLREIANTAPYMHDGRFRTLEEVVDFYDRGGLERTRYGCAPATVDVSNIGFDLPIPKIFLPRVIQRRTVNPRANSPTEIQPLNLSEREKKDLVAFLKCLSGQGWQHVEPPVRFPD